MNSKLYAKCDLCDFEKLFAKKGYSYFTNGDYNLNIIGVRSNQHNKVTNKYDDCLVLVYKVNGKVRRRIYSITTEPGLKYMKAPVNAKGTAILAPGQYKGAYKIDKHRGRYNALCQRNKPVKVYRDDNRDLVYNYNVPKIHVGMFGINIHRSAEFWTVPDINGYSAGCQVFDDPNEFIHFMILVKKSAKIFGNCFTYTLITEEDIDELKGH